MNHYEYTIATIEALNAAAEENEFFGILATAAADFDADTTISPKYSGRGMYGRRCIAVITDSLTETLLMLGRAGCEDAPSMDNMGRGYVLYWPQITPSDELVEALGAIRVDDNDDGE